MKFTLSLQRSQQGIGMVDIMVGMVIGLIGMLVIFQSFSAFEAQKRTTTSANDAQDAGLMALTTIERDARMAGYGMFFRNEYACSEPKLRRYSTGLGADTVLMPIQVTDGGGSNSDSITISYSTSASAAIPTPLMFDPDKFPGKLFVEDAARTAMYQPGQLIMLALPPSAAGGTAQPCSLLQINAVTVDPTILKKVELDVSSGATNPPTASLTAYKAPKDTGKKGAFVVNLGTFDQTRYSVQLDAAQNGRLVALDMNNPGGPSVEIADGIVGMQAQYGVAASTASGAAQKTLSNWVQPGTAPWNAPTANEVTRIKAVRIAIIARSQLMEKADVDSRFRTCTNVSGTTTTGPCAWRDTAANPAPTFNLTANADWQRYRYRVYETILPIRNTGWQIQ